MHRRDFLARSAAAATTAALLAADRTAPNDRLRAGFIGVGGRARAIIFDEWVPGADIVAVADCFLPRCEAMADKHPAGRRWAKYQDYRRMLEKEKLDIVFVETTTHARVLACIHALQAGCDVYGEKPLTLTVAEGRPLVNWVRKTNRIFQTGTQQRSMPINIHASRLVRDGAIGKVHTVLACNFLAPEVWAARPAQPVPKDLDWNAWCNQTPLRPYHAELQYGWSKYTDYDGGGQSWGVTGWGTHALDQVQCALGTDDTGPVEVWPEVSGPTAPVMLRYASGVLLKVASKPRKYEDLGAIFVGDRGRIEIMRGSYLSDRPELMKDAPPTIAAARAGETRPHLTNFFECVRSRKQPTANVETGHRATTVCHLINICRQLGRKLKCDPVAEKFAGDEQANALLTRPRRKGYELPPVG
ncbi:MAG: Gfo/Idh/MocA family oxidoreductase [Gemmataceae bacterium]